MLIKFLNHGGGSGRAAAEYLTRAKDHKGVVREQVSVLRGDPWQVGDVADSLTFAHRYTSGVIAFAPDDQPTDEQISAVLDDYERVAFAGLTPDRYAFSAVLHRDTGGGCHVHVISACVDLETKKALNIAPPGWMSSFDPLRDMFNWAHGWARPDDPRRTRLVQPGHGAYISAGQLRAGLLVEPDIKAYITEFVMQRVTEGGVRDRDGVLKCLIDAGMEITRNGADYITVQDPETGAKARLKGGLYGRGFDVGGEVEKEDSRGQLSVREIDPRRAGEARAKLESAITKRAGYNADRFRKKDGNSEIGIGQRAENAEPTALSQLFTHGDSVGGGDSGGGVIVDDLSRDQPRSARSTDNDDTLANEQPKLYSYGDNRPKVDMVQRISDQHAILPPVPNQTIKETRDERQAQKKPRDGVIKIVVSVIDHFWGRIRRKFKQLELAVGRLERGTRAFDVASNRIEQASKHLGEATGRLGQAINDFSKRQAVERQEVECQEVEQPTPNKRMR